MHQILIRLDANEEIGTGHFWRCFTLAKALLETPCEVVFVSRFMPDNLERLLLNSNMSFCRIEKGKPEDYKLASEIPEKSSKLQSLDAQDTMQAIANYKQPVWTIVDNYALGYRWEKTIMALGCKILAIDDLHNRRHYCDLLLDQNLITGGEKLYRKLVPGHCRLLFGPRYCILRDEFFEAYRNRKAKTTIKNRLLISFGGTDSSNLTFRTISTLNTLQKVHDSSNKLIPEVVIGNQNRNKEKLVRYCKKLKIKLHVQTKQFAEIMANSDLAIGAGGLELWERCSMGLPSLVVESATNQKEQILQAAQAGVIYAPDPELSLDDVLKKHLYALAANTNLKNLLKDNCRTLFDFKGKKRIIDCFKMDKLELRAVSLSDAELIYKWRNNPQVRKYSVDSGCISLAEHKKWLVEKIKNKNSILLLGILKQKPCGVIRYELSVNNAEVSIYLDPLQIGKGIGYQLLCSGEKWLMDNQPNIIKITATVLEENLPSASMFNNAGYHKRLSVMEKFLKDD